MKSRFAFALGISIFCGFGAPRVAACINDRDSDTLANEGRELPHVIRVITGRFERNPPLYFQMRIARVERELRSHSERLPLYDDIAVAHDRLGRSDLAILWMNRKYARLQKLDAKTKNSASTREALYRYYANNGSFWAHRWLHGGADRTKIGEMKTARAIRIKPNAHFGRETYQLLAMDWILNPRVKHGKSKARLVSLTEYISARSNYSDADKIPTGLAGLIVLGNAWESLDVFNALRDKLHYDKPALSYLAALRCRELIAQGRRSLLPGSGSGAQLERTLGIDEATLNPPDDVFLSGAATRYETLRVNSQNQATLQKAYRKLRDEAEAWQSRRTAYMMARLQNGKHPDTDKTFWRDWRETPPPSLELPWHSERAAQRKSDLRDMIGLGVFAATLLFGGIFCLRLRHRRFA